MKENHDIDWDSAKIVERERDDQARGIKEAVYIRILPNMNRDEGRHHLSHLYDDLLGANARTKRGGGGGRNIPSSCHSILLSSSAVL